VAGADLGCPFLCSIFQISTFVLALVVGQKAYKILILKEPDTSPKPNSPNNSERRRVARGVMTGMMVMVMIMMMMMVVVMMMMMMMI
jgi:hypothetical protein